MEALATSSLAGLANASVAGTSVHFFSSALLWGTDILQTVFGRTASLTSAVVPNRSLDGFVNTETPIALDRLLCNIGPHGCGALGVVPGIVIASPDERADYVYTWTRDAGLVFKCITDRITHSYDADLQKSIEDYVVSQASLQGVSNPSGSLTDGAGLAEPKFEVDLTAFTANWGRPQRDGPALRAISLLAYARWLVENGYESTAEQIVWPIIRNDIEYVAQFWNETGFDIWEEVEGSSFFTIASQHRALIEGASMAERIGKPGAKYSDAAPHIRCFLQTFWLPSEGYIAANINTGDGRTGKDASTILGSIHTFDATLGCDDTTFQPCSARALSNLKRVVDSFRFFNINNGIPHGSALSVGRYAEDVYYNGNAWYLCTAAVAEQLYDAIYVWKDQGSISVTDVSLPFFQDLIPGTAVGTYQSGSKTYKGLLDAVSDYADGFLEIISKHTPGDGSMAEQYSKDDGTPVGARDLTWSYAAFLTAAARREGIVPRSWASNETLSVPEKCQKYSVKGSYSSATETAFPGNQTPTGGVPTPTSPPAPCATATTVTMTFIVRATTEYGQTVKVSGNDTKLGNWDTSAAVALSAERYTDYSPLWTGNITLDPGEVIEYKYITVGSDASVAWENGPNRRYSVPRSCETAAAKRDTWRG